MLLNIYNEKVPAEEPVRLSLQYNLGSVELNVVDENGDDLSTLLVISSTSNDIFLCANVDPELGFKLDNERRIKIRKGKI